MKLGLLTYGYPKILLMMEMSVILFLKDLKVSVCSYGETPFIIQAKALTIGFFKEIINLEPYLLLLNKNHRSICTNYRTAKHRLPIEVGRWGNIPRSERKCFLCDDHVIGDEYHFLFECYFFSKQKMPVLT